MGRGQPRRRPTFDAELAAYEKRRGLVAGIDEAGRGPWAGPVVAAAVVLDPRDIPDCIDDSKALEPADRAEAYELVLATALYVGIGVSHVREIDRINILNATMAAMQRAYCRLAVVPVLALIDGNRAPRLGCETETIVGGDATCASIAAASIVAKVTRDRLMISLGRKLPGYGFERHKGYGTPEHQAKLVALGPCTQHRRSFAPVRIALGLAETFAKEKAGPREPRPVRSVA